MIPLKYNLRSLRARWTTSLMTVFGTALVVWATVLAFGLAAGLDHALDVSGGPLDLVVLRKGATAETVSGINDELVRQIAALPGIATNADGAALSSGELVVVVNTTRRTDGGHTNLILRGVTPVAHELRPGFRVVEGRNAQPGLREAITSRSIAGRFTGAALGEELDVLDTRFLIVGLFEASDSAAESEVWTDLKVLGQASRRTGVVSSVQLRATGPDALLDLKSRLIGDEQFSLKAITEREYYADQALAGIAIKFVGRIIALFLTVGAMFAVANTMFAAVASRAREIGTLRALGFSRRSVMAGFLLESTVLALVGGAIGCLGTLPVNGLSTGTANWVTFSELTFTFRFGRDVLIEGALLAMATGLAGGLLPAVRAVRMKVVDALRET
ncbi:MAG TPA: ABC transporter permease [Pirellulales bacterium]|jgi:putative ABC transport system permease protein|nr:ABC transporter permease [Pirellulales bacterium]